METKKDRLNKIQNIIISCEENINNLEYQLMCAKAARREAREDLEWTRDNLSDSDNGIMVNC